MIYIRSNFKKTKDYGFFKNKTSTNQVENLHINLRAQ